MSRRVGREPTTAHPACTCTVHDHERDAEHCIGTHLIYQRPDGTEYAGACRILPGVVLAPSRDRCPLHGKAAS